jgi:hypothetical protein
MNLKKIIPSILVALPFAVMSVSAEQADALQVIVKPSVHTQPARPKVIARAKRRVLVPAHWERIGHNRRWVPAHYEYR